MKHLLNVFQKRTKAKVKAAILVGPQIIECTKFPDMLTEGQKAAWNSFVAVVQGFLGNHKADNYVELVETMVKIYHTMVCRMSLKGHILDTHLHNLKHNIGGCSEEQGGRSHQDMQQLECRYQGQYKENMMGDYVWGLVRESDHLHDCLS